LVLLSLPSESGDTAAHAVKASLPLILAFKNIRFQAAWRAAIDRRQAALSRFGRVASR
jgi:hypothetical protein